MGGKQTKPYGSWKSKVTADSIATDSKRLSEVHLTEDGTLYWLEGRPQNKGRTFIVKRPAGSSAEQEEEFTTSLNVDMTEAPTDVRTMVHEYGGGAYVVGDGILFYSNLKDHCIYGIALTNSLELPEPIQITSNDESSPITRRYADMTIDSTTRGRIICVCEEHDSEKGGMPTNKLVAITIATGEMTILNEGNDFYSSPRVSPDGSQIVFLSWDLPKMPWEGTRLWIGTFNKAGGLNKRSHIAGGEAAAAAEPRWGPPDGTGGADVYFCNDKSGFWNIYRYDPRDGTTTEVCETSADFCRPQWTFGNKHYGFAADGRLVAAFCEEGVWALGVVRTDAGAGSRRQSGGRTRHAMSLPTMELVDKIDVPYTAIASISVAGSKVAFLAASPMHPQELVVLDLDTKVITSVQKSSQLSLPAAWVSAPAHLRFPLADGHTGHAWYYPPTNPEFEPLPGELPPLLVELHGGPTSCAEGVFKPKTQYWTSRGFAVLDVNYRGSAGFGRWYWWQLKEAWGRADIEDAAAAALHAVECGLADRGRLAIHGGSAGGYTALAALTFADVFRAGASFYGISDLELLAQDTHKFESGYLEFLVGPYPKDRAEYRARSPLYNLDKLSSPLIFFHGMEDKVVPINQAELCVQALEQKGVPVAFVPFEGEGHGFRLSANIKKALNIELYFYSRVFGFSLPDLKKEHIVPIVNLDSTITDDMQLVPTDKEGRPVRRRSLLRAGT